MMTFEKVEAAVHWLIDNAKRIGGARRRLVYAERMVDRIKALEMKRHSELSVSAQEREAKASDAYLDAIIEEANAAGEFETLRSERDGYTAMIELFRTMEATARRLRDASHATQPDR